MSLSAWLLHARAETIRASFELENKCAEQARALNELVGEEVEDEELENHASMKLTAEGLQNIFSQVDDTGAETDCAELARKCIEQMLQDAKALHGCFHFYCKLAERGAQDADVNSKHATYLSSMETMDLDELKALIVGAKLQLPKLEEAYTKAYSQTVSKIQDESEHELGMGFVHFQECLIRLAIQLSPQWARGASDNLSFVPEVQKGVQGVAPQVVLLSRALVIVGDDCTKPFAFTGALHHQPAYRSKLRAAAA